MNNNNLQNINFIGSTHLDYSKITSNYILATSNVLEGHITNTSNILEGHILNAKNYNITYTNNLRSDVNKWINEEVEYVTSLIETNKTHTYIYNSSLSGEIRFWCKSTHFFPPEIPSNDPPYRVKKDPDWKLKLYYTFDQNIDLTWFSGWVDIINLVISLVASDNNTGIAISGLQIEIDGLNKKLILKLKV